MNSHVVIKLSNGTEVYGKIDTSVPPSTLLLVEDPLVTEEVLAPDGSFGTVLVKFCVATNERSVALISSSVLTIMLMSDTFKRYYEASVHHTDTALKSYESRLSEMTDHMELLLVPNLTQTDTNTIH